MKNLIKLFCLLILTSCSVSNDITNEVEYVIKNPNLSDGIYELNETGNKFYTLKDSSKVYSLNQKPYITSKDFKSINMASTQLYLPEEVALNIYFTKKGTKLFSDITRQNLNKKIAYVINNKILSIPNIHAELKGGRSQFLFPKVFLDSLFRVK